MNAFLLIVNFVLTSVIAGLLGGATMVFVMWLMTRAGLFAGEWEPPPRRNMIVALGGLLTKSRESATRVGLMAHAISAIGFALLYTLAMLWLHQTRLPAALVLGLGIGFFHGLIVSLMLVWVIAEGHPFEEYGEAGLAVGLSHLIGHVAYGAMVGLVVGISSLA
jgi:hypothetical protein